MPRLTPGDLARRIVVALALSVFAWRAYQSWLASHQASLLLLLLSETLTVVLVVLARPPSEYDARPYATMLTAVGTFYFLFVRVTPAAPLVPKDLGLVVQAAGLSLQIAGKLWLGRRFGLLPANRGIVTTGPYRLVRHPIYAGYFLNHVGYLAGSFSVRNALLYAALYAVQVARILEEERLLRRDAEYQAYAGKVRYRALPFIF
jgi:protein-S-isoprenylcysteine O-methyltransferase Ste14